LLSEDPKTEAAVQISTIAGWSNSFYRLSDATTKLCLVYFLVIIIVVAYVMVNLFLAVLKLKFATASRKLLGCKDGINESKVHCLTSNPL
jgi:hypothetical protein